MKKILLSIFFVILINDFCIAQETNKLYKNAQHNLFFELFGSSWYIYNITYDCSFQLKEKNKISVGLGMQYFPRLDLYGMTPQINYLYGKRRHLELGVGYAILREKWFHNSGYYKYFVLHSIPIRVGYRFQKEEGGYFWKIAVLGLIGDFYPLYGTYILPYAGVSFGYTFKKRDSW